MSNINKLVCVSLCTTVTVPDDLSDEEILKLAHPGLVRNLYEGGVENLDLIRADTPGQAIRSFSTIVNADIPGLSPTGDIPNPSGLNNTGLLIVCAGGIVQDVYSKSPIQYVLVDYSNIDYSQPLVAEDVQDGGPFNGIKSATLVTGSMANVFRHNTSGVNANPSVHNFLAGKMEEIGF